MMDAMASQITGVLIVYSSVCSGTAQRKHQSSASLVFVRGMHRWPVNSSHKGSATRKMFPFDGVIIRWSQVIVNTRYPCLSGIWYQSLPQSKYTCDFIWAMPNNICMGQWMPPWGYLTDCSPRCRNNALIWPTGEAVSTCLVTIDNNARKMTPEPIPGELFT